jgi:hypothetical protein
VIAGKPQTFREPFLSLVQVASVEEAESGVEKR